MSQAKSAEKVIQEIRRKTRRQFCTSSNQRRPMSLVYKRDSWLVDRSVRRV